MQFIKYIERKFKPGTLAIIEQANEIIDDYFEQGYSLTLRQIYYQFVARDLIANKQSEYKRLGSIINDGRLAGLIDWEAIEDRTRNLQRFSSWDSPASILRAAAENYRIDLWKRQPCAVEVWIEKDALIGIVENACETHRVPYYSCRGYTSQSEIWAAAMRFDRELDGDAERAVVIHLGDHDPSGLDMTRDIQDRLRMLAYRHGQKIEVKRIALSMAQVEEHTPPPNPAKVTDSRFEGYAAQYGNESWELDALEPGMLVELITDTVGEFIDWDLWDEDVIREGADKARLVEVANKF